MNDSNGKFINYYQLLEVDPKADAATVKQAYLTEALISVRPTTLEWLTTARNYARYANESGHYDDILQFLKKHGKK